MVKSMVGGVYAMAMAGSSTCGDSGLLYAELKING